MSENEVCTWMGDDDGVFATDCGHHFVFTEGGGPGEDGIIYCCYCGKTIKREQQCWRCPGVATNPLDRFPTCEKCAAEEREEEASA
jgi:hypothetical protein